MASHVGIPVVGIGVATLDILEVHVLGFNDDDVVDSIWLSRLGQGRWCGDAIGLHVGALSGAVDDDVDGAVMLHVDGVGLCRFVVFGSGISHVARCARDVAGQRIGWLRGHALHNNHVGLSRNGVAAIVVQIEVDVVGVLAYDAARQFAILQLQRVASVVEQWDFSRCSLLCI